MITLEISCFLLSRSKASRSLANRIIFKSWSTILIKILGGKIEVKKWEPEKKTIFVSNHVSYLDIIILNTIHPFAFVSKSEVAKWPLLGRMARNVDTIFLDRNNPLAVKNLYKDIDDKIAHNDSILVFPEGTTSNGKEILDFKKGIFMPILRAKSHADVLGCLAIKYHLNKKYGSVEDKIAWWGDMGFFSHFLSLVMIPKWKVVVSARQYEIKDSRSCAVVSKATNEVVRKEFERI
ncbi:MAG: 1-acyl-sn-glycerol-3-phosphate acyltransferase [Rickettsiales bacterium]|nr:1-acyl-sn-glycerol-3-phosphate acyltransferase [Rickettsiales bacterium]